MLRGNSFSSLHEKNIRKTDDLLLADQSGMRLRTRWNCYQLMESLRLRLGWWGLIRALPYYSLSCKGVSNGGSSISRCPLHRSFCDYTDSVMTRTGSLWGLPKNCSLRGLPSRVAPVSLSFMPLAEGLLLAVVLSTGQTLVCSLAL